MSNERSAADWFESVRRRVHVMGIVNVTPDSFSDGGRFFSEDSALRHALTLVEEGADMLDIGGESTRPGAEPVPEEEEIRRTAPVIRAVRRHSAIPVSIDTTKSNVARAALEAGATMVNDISGATFDPDMAAVVHQSDAALVVMHIRGTPRTMQDDPYYDDVVTEVTDWLARRCVDLKAQGIDRLIIDPGLGFGKRQEDNYTLINRLESFAALGYPVMIGSSRKSFLGAPFQAPPDDRLEGTIVSNILAMQRGATILRVHDVRPMRRALEIAQRITGA